MKRVLLLVLLLAVAYWLKAGNEFPESAATSAVALPDEEQPDGGVGAVDAHTDDAAQSDSDVLSTAFANRQSNLQLAGSGRVVKLLRDDTQGSPHQRFLLRTGTGQTLLVAHNIELAPRIVDIAEGDTVRFYGEYEWNEQGGVIHWTHHDPRGKHPDGWLEHRGQRYQ